MKLSDYAKQMGVRYETAWRWFRDGKIQGQRIGPHTIIITEGHAEPVVATERVLSMPACPLRKIRSNLDSQADRLAAYCAAKGYQVRKIVKEVGSGVNEARPKLLALLEDQSLGLIVVEHKDRLTRFGFRYLDTLLRSQGRAIEVVNLADNGVTMDRKTCWPTSQRFSIPLRPASMGSGGRSARRRAIIRTLEAGESEGDDATG